MYLFPYNYIIRAENNHQNQFVMPAVTVGKMLFINIMTLRCHLNIRTILILNYDCYKTKSKPRIVIRRIFGT